MRKKFEQQLSMGVIPIGEVKINQKSRHQLAPVLMALQHIFCTEELNEQVFRILEDKILTFFDNFCGINPNGVELE